MILELLGFEKNNQQISLYKKPENEVGIVMSPQMKLIFMIFGMALFFILIFLFAPGTESGAWYNSPHY